MKRRGQNTRGSVLIVVLVVCLGLVSITLLFGHSMMMTYRGADNDIAGRQADQAIEGAIRYVEAILARPENARRMPELTLFQNEAVPVGEATFWLLGRDAEQPSGQQGQSFEPVFGLVDEASKLNLNTATLGMLEALPGMTAELAAAIIDWRDADEEVTENGAESETYMLRQPSFECKNAPFESIAELALLHGADASILYGEDANGNGILEPNEDDGAKSPPADDSNGALTPGVLEYVTVFTREENSRADNMARVNVSRPSPALTMLLQEALGQQRAAEVATRVGTAAVRSPLEFFARSGMSADEFAKIEPDISVSGAAFVSGLINVNTASEAVLACIPGIGPEKAAQLIAARQSRSEAVPSVAWVRDLLTDTEIVLAGRFLTAQSWQVTADIAAVGRHGRGFRRARVLIDRSTGTPRVVYRRNLAPLGWALGAKVREELATREERL